MSDLLSKTDSDDNQGFWIIMFGITCIVSLYVLKVLLPYIFLLFDSKCIYGRIVSLDKKNIIFEYKLEDNEQIITQKRSFFSNEEFQKIESKETIELCYSRFFPKTNLISALESKSRVYFIMFGYVFLVFICLLFYRKAKGII